VKVPEVPVTANKTKISISAKETIQKMTLKVKPMTSQ